MKKIIVAVTGASGSILAQKMIRELVALGHEVHLISTDQGKKVFEYELDMSIEAYVDAWTAENKLIYHDNQNFFSPLASGSYAVDAMIIVPCSMGTLGKIRSVTSDHLICRAADVMLKEKRPLVMVVRETPLSSLHLENMLHLSQAGALIMPPVPAYYNKPKDIDEMTSHTVGRILSTVGIQSREHKTWKGSY